jgi:hypothetical protein
VRIAQEINLQYIDMRQVTTNLTPSQTMVHTHYAKTIRKIVMTIATAMMTVTVMTITTVNMTETRYTAIATNQTTNDNQCH